MRDELGLTRQEVVELLKQNGHDSFNIDSITEYAAIIKAHMTLKLGIMDKIAQTPEKKPMDCHIPGCDGNRKTDRAWGWICTVGGLRHSIAWRTAERMVGDEADYEEVQAKAVWLVDQMEVLHEAKEKEIAQAREEERRRTATSLQDQTEVQVQAEPGLGRGESNWQEDTE